MSELSVVLKKIVSAIGLNAADEANLHAEIDGLIPTVLEVAVGGETAAQGVQTSLVPLLENFAGSITGRLVQFVENRLAGVPAHAALPPMATLTAPADPELTSAAPSQETLAAQATQPAAGVVAPVVEPVKPVPMNMDDTEEGVAARAAAIASGAPMTAPGDANLTSPGQATATVPTPPVVAEDPTLASASDADFRAAGFKFNPNTGAAL